MYHEIYTMCIYVFVMHYGLLLVYPQDYPRTLPKKAPHHKID